MNTQSTRPRFSLFDELDKGLNTLVNEVLHSERGQSKVPPLTIYEFDNRYVVECDVPGVELADIGLSIDNGVLEITGHRQQPVLDEGTKVTIDERRCDKFHRKLKLGKDVNSESVDAELGDGVLKVTIHKSDSVLPRKIEIRKADES